MPINRVVVIGASAGGIETLRSLVAGLPKDFNAPIAVVLHMSPQSPGVLADILGRAGALPAVSVTTRMHLEPGRIYVAAPDMHLLIEPGVLRVTKGPRENRFRPAIDPLFRSAAQIYGPKAIGVILSGNLDDGTAGLWAIKKLGGISVVQDPADALFPSMAMSAIQHVDVDYIVPLAEMARLLVRLTSAAVEQPRVAVPHEMEIEVDIAKEQNPLDAGLEQLGAPSIYACPDCHGVLLQINEGNRVRFRCHTGHAFSVASLIAAVSEGVEESLWNTIRALEEAEMLMRRMADHIKTHHGSPEAEQLMVRAEEARRQSDAIRRLVTNRDPLPSIADH